MRLPTFILCSWLLACSSALAADIPSLEGAVIGNPPQPPAQCKTLADIITLDDDNSGDLYFLYDCRDADKHTKFLRMWRLRVESLEAGSAPVDPFLGVPIAQIRVVNEVIVNRHAKTRHALSIYSCSIKGENGAVAAAILPYHDSRDDLMIKNALGIWRVRTDTLEPLVPSQIGECKIFRC